MIKEVFNIPKRDGYQLLILFLFILIMSCCNNPNDNASEPQTEVANGISRSTFKVWGNCGMCKETIERSLAVEGVINAEWDSDTKNMSVEFDGSKITLDKIQELISGSGYDTPKYKAKDSTYSRLHECCKYQRKE